MELLDRSGYQEVRPSLVLRESPEERSVRFFDGDQLVSLRWDFTVALAGMVVRRFPEPPARIAYSGDVFRRASQPWEAVQSVEVGCERIHAEAESSHEVDLELARLLMAVPGVVGLKGGLLALGDAALLRRPLEEEQLPDHLAQRLVWALDHRALHRAEEALGDHPAARRLLTHAQALLADPGENSLSALDQSPYANLLKEERAHLQQTLATLKPMLPEGLALRLDLADVKGLSFYTGPTLRLWAPGAQEELASGGRYDRLFPELGRPWRAAGFCVRLSRLLELAETRPELFGSL